MGDVVDEDGKAGVFAEQCLDSIAPAMCAIRIPWAPEARQLERIE